MEVPEVVKAAETLVAFVEALEAAEVVKAAETLEVFVEALEAAEVVKAAENLEVFVEALEVVKAAEAFEALEADPGSPIDLENFVELGVHFLSDLGLAYLFAVAEFVP